jgi:hypothetical protein
MYNRNNEDKGHLQASVFLTIIFKASICNSIRILFPHHLMRVIKSENSPSRSFAVFFSLHHAALTKHHHDDDDISYS